MKRAMPGGAVVLPLVFLLILTAGCSEEECALCPECPSCTLAVSFEIEPIFDACVLDGYPTSAMKDGRGDLILSNSLLIVKNNESPINEYNVETRGIMEFDITPITGTLEEAYLELVTDGQEYMPRNVSLVLCNYIGNGTFKIFDFNIGQPVDTVLYDLEWTVVFDVADALRAHIAAGDTCAGFNVRINPPTSQQTGAPAVLFRSTYADPRPRIYGTQQVIVEP